MRLDWNELDRWKYADESHLIAGLPQMSNLTAPERRNITAKAISLVQHARKHSGRKGLMESFLEEFGLSNTEGLALMCLAEALLRVPDADTADQLIAEKIGAGDWGAHARQSESFLVNASTWGLMLTGRIMKNPEKLEREIGDIMGGLVRRAGEPVVRAAMMQAMRIMGEQFVLGRTIEEAIAKAKKKGRICSFDMLGEGARTDADADRYFERYKQAIVAVSSVAEDGPKKAHGISVKISALFPRYEAVKSDRLNAELYPRILELCQMAASANINLCLDAEEADSLVISLQLFERLVRDPALDGWQGLGLAVQAYQKCVFEVLDKLDRLSLETGKEIMVRLVKGAYWDSEIKHAQEMGMADYPVWTRKSTTDLAYLAAARRLLKAENLYPQFATHNAWSLAAVKHMAEEMDRPFESQRLHGMGRSLYDAEPFCRIYAPVGSHDDLLPYLVRRLLENGANTSFVHSFLDDDVPVEEVAESPFEAAGDIPHRHSLIPLPEDMFGTRKNSKGYDMTMQSTRDEMSNAIAALKQVKAGPIINGEVKSGGTDRFSPSDTGLAIGSCLDATENDIKAAFQAAKKAHAKWDGLGGLGRARILRDMANALDAKTPYFCALMAREAGKVHDDSIAEVREAVDFLRYYADEAERLFDPDGTRLPGPAGETNHHRLKGRGTFICISPWNFPLAIFTGQIAAALAAGNCVLAKPAEQTPLTAFEAIKTYLEAGLPKGALHLLPGDGRVGGSLTAHPDTAGVAFTGSTEVARIINRTLAAKDGPIVPLIAETGGLNAMFVDTSALKEQVVDDVIESAFNAAGQRCSALRILVIPKETSDDVIDCLSGAMDELALGDPADPSTDIGPIIDQEARGLLQSHLDRMGDQATVLKQIPAPLGGTFFGPAMVELKSLDLIEKESFGPVLHVIRYTRKSLPKICAQLADKGYGLTLGIHSRLEKFRNEIIDRSACSPLAAKACPGPAPRPAGRFMCRALRPSKASASILPHRAVTRNY